MNEDFANTFWKKGYKRHISPNCNDKEEAVYALVETNKSTSAEDLLLPYPEIHDIVRTDSYECPEPKAFNDDSIKDHIEKVYQLNRGPELGTFLGSILSATFKE
ncbi:hypothetical protein HRS9122_08230 [Pyrenophora teres f. teres]|nr:hypothetical protein HRS9122_08230 [Pyrenophora teres f. teres]